MRDKLIKINGWEYDYGCYSKLFTSQSRELISAYDVVTSEKQSNDISTFEHFINVCGKYGMDTDMLRQFISPAPIYDSGRCLFVQDSVPANDRDLLSIKTESLGGDEMKMLKLVNDRNCLDVTKLPARSYIEGL